MDKPSTSAAALKLEIERLKGVIDQRKTGKTVVRPTYPASTFTYPRSNSYVNPNYKPPSKPYRPSVPSAVPLPKPNIRIPVSVPQDTRDVVIDGVAFESSGRSLVRKDLPKPASMPSATTIVPSAGQRLSFARNKAGTFTSGPRPYKPKTSTRGRLVTRNMTLDNTRRPYQRRLNPKRKYSDKQCPRFTTTGSCNRGLTCFYQHDPSKITICWPFLQDKCPHTAETCPLSHDPTPQRTPLCVHFANNGRCNRPNCPFPHVRVGQREGICRDFAVLGYCEQGLDCEKQHVRECPDFAEKGSCTTRGCKLPHVIRANRNRKAAVSASTSMIASAASSVVDTDDASSSPQLTAEDGQLGDEFISLTFHESESEEEADEEDEVDEDDENLDEGEESQELHSDNEQ